MTEQRLIDAAAREAIRTRLDRNFLVEAGAGSGKTSCLVDRMAALLAGGHCRPEKLAAVTFTRKAAGELKERFQVRLERMFREEKDPVVRQRLSEALGKMERTFVGTIHSFCSRLLRERPVEAGVTPDFTEIEGLEERLLSEMAWEDYLLEVRLQEPQAMEQLSELDLSPADLKEAFLQLIRYPDAEMVGEKTPYPDLSGVRARLEEFCLLAQQHLPVKQHPDGWDGLQATARRALRWQRMFDLQQDRYLLRLLEKMDKNAGPTFKRWPNREDAETLAKAFADFRENGLKPARKAWLEYRHFHLLAFLIPAAERYHDLRMRENKLNFQDLLMLAAKLLKNNPEVRAYFQERYTHLLVDEFQDTDPIQAEVMFFLTGTDLHEKDWTRLTPKPASLFVVGDPKQSIYRFRRADIQIYNRVKELIVSSGGEILNLTTNFRSLPGLIQWSNQAFADLFAPFKKPYQAEFVPMDPDPKKQVGNKEEDGGNCVYCLRLDDVKGNNQEQIARQDARRIAAWIHHCLTGGLKLSRTEEERARGLTEQPMPGDFLLLLRYKKYMSLYARALEGCAVPFVMSGGGGIAESTELKELLCLLQALADPDNPVPLVATLRGLFFGISDDQLYRFKRAGGRFSFLQDIPEDSDQEVQDVFLPVWETLRRFWRLTRNLPPSSAMQKIISELGILPLALAAELGKGRAGYILQALELQRDREVQGETSFSGAVDFLLRLLEDGAEEELDVEGGSTSSVRIMNLHKAKGLEAPVVILANPGRDPSHDPDLHVVRNSDRARGYMVIQKRGSFGSQTLALPPCWDDFQEEEKKYQQAEELRLLYVAATRAKDLLVISTYPKKPDKSPWYPLEQFLMEKENLPVLELPAAQKDARAEPIMLPMLEQARESLAMEMNAIVSSTFARRSATGAGSEKKVPGRTTQGRGTAWGKVIHAALENMIKGIPGGKQATQHAITDFDENRLLALAEKLIRQQGDPSVQPDEVLRALKKITASPFWQRVCASSERHTEVPFGLQENETYITGVVDLVFREAGVWVLVDYKTDAVEDDAHLQALVEHYTPQVELYCHCWEAITGEKVVEAGLFFTDRAYHIKIMES